MHQTLINEKKTSGHIFYHQITSGDTVCVAGRSAPTHWLSMSDFSECHMTVNIKNDLSKLSSLSTISYFFHVC